MGMRTTATTWCEQDSERGNHAATALVSFARKQQGISPAGEVVPG